MDLSDVVDTTSGYEIAELKGNILSKKRKNKKINANFNSFIEKNNPDCALIYTDGSCDRSAKKVGFGLTCPALNTSLKFRIGDHFSVFQAEAFAINRAINLVLANQIKKALIVSDSKSVLSALRYGDVRGKQESCIYVIKLLFNMAKENGLTISFLWIPSHLGIVGNEIADTLAGEALLLNHISIKKYQYYNLFGTLREQLKQKSMQLVLEQSNIKGRNYFSLKKVSFNKPWFNNVNEKRDLITFISRIRTGHTCCSDHLKRKNIKSDDTCECKEAIQDLNHVFFKCKINFAHSSELLIEIFKVFPEMEEDVIKLAFSGNSQVYKLLFNFAKTNKLVI